MASSMEVPIIQKRIVPGNICEITCKLENRFTFRAGQHIQVYVKDLLYHDPKGNMRTFNILSSPNNSEFLSFAFLNSDSGFKKTIRDSSTNNVQIKGPFGMFTLPDEGQTISFATEGIGIVPCISMLLFATEDGFANKINLFYFGNGSTSYLEDLKAIQNENPNISLKIKPGCFDQNAFKKEIKSFKNNTWYVSGAPQKTKEIKISLLQSGISQNNIKIEEFTGYQ